MAKTTNREIIQRLRSRRDSFAGFELRYTGLSKKAEKELQATLEKSFKGWWDSWIAGDITELALRLPNTGERRA